VDFKIQITQAALADFEEILAYSWAKFPATAERFGNAVLDHVDILKSFPYVGSPVKGLPGVRQLVHTPIVIYYRVREDPDVVEVLHFWHGARGNLRF
jgi:plasmid stabilization system protein ParE